MKVGDLVKIKDSEGDVYEYVETERRPLIALVTDIGEYIADVNPKHLKEVLHTDGSISPALPSNSQWILILCKHTHKEKMIQTWIMDCAVELVK